jgi:hypothetical protein
MAERVRPRLQAYFFKAGSASVNRAPKPSRLHRNCRVKATREERVFFQAEWNRGIAVSRRGGFFIDLEEPDDIHSS